MRKVGVFIDMQNVYYTTKSVFPGKKINWRVFREYLIRQWQDSFLTFTAFVPYDPRNQRQLGFLSWLGLNGFRVVSRPVKLLPDQTFKGDLDVQVAVEVLDQAPFLEEIVLVTGDGDFSPLVKRLCRMGRHVRVLGPKDCTSVELILACHQFTCFHDLPQVIEDAPAIPEPVS